VNEESEDIEDPQIISPFVDTESIAINPDLWACPTSAKIPYYREAIKDLIDKGTSRPHRQWPHLCPTRAMPSDQLRPTASNTTK
jgi:hypothetical protein